MTRVFFCALLALTLFVGGTSAQCPGFHATTALTINGADPAASAGNQVSLSSPYSLALDVADSGGTALPLILLAGSGISCGAVPATPTLSIDISGAVIVLDGTGTGLGISALAGLGVTPLSLSLAFPTAVWQGMAGPSFQAIVLDPSAGTAVPFISTAAGQPVFAASSLTTYALGDDQAAAHTLGGAGISFGGVMQSTLNMGSNGVISFMMGVADYSQTMMEHFNGWNTSGNSGVSLLYTDLNRQGSGGSITGATCDVLEDLVTGDVTVSYNNQNWWGSMENAGNFSASFSSTVCTLDYSGLIGQVSGTSNFIIGVTDGDAATGTDTDVSVAIGGAGLIGSLGTYVSVGNNDSIAENYISTDAAAVATQGTFTFIDLGNFLWTII